MDKIRSFFTPPATRKQFKHDNKPVKQESPQTPESPGVPTVNVQPVSKVSIGDSPPSDSRVSHPKLLGLERVKDSPSTLSSASIASKDSGISIWMSRNTSRGSLRSISISSKRTSCESTNGASCLPTPDEEPRSPPPIIARSILTPRESSDNLPAISENTDTGYREDYTEGPDRVTVNAGHLAELYQACMKLVGNAKPSPELKSSLLDLHTSLSLDTVAQSKSPPATNTPSRSADLEHVNLADEKDQYPTDSEIDGPYNLRARGRHQSSPRREHQDRRTSLDTHDRRLDSSRHHRRTSVPVTPSLHHAHHAGDRREIKRRKTIHSISCPRKRTLSCPARVFIKRSVPESLIGKRYSVPEVLQVYKQSLIEEKEIVEVLQRESDKCLCETRLSRLIKQNLPEFIRSTGWTNLFSHLVSQDLLDPHNQQKIRSDSMTDVEKGNYFYTEVLPSKGRDAYSRFYECLCEESYHSGHKDLADILSDEGLK